MRIGIDIDDTICKTWKHIKPLFKKHFKVDNRVLQKKSYSRALNVPVDEYYEFYKKIVTPEMSYIPIKKDAKRYINKLNDEGHEIYFITARSEKDIINHYELTENYLAKNGIKYDKLLTCASDKGKACLENKIDLFIDDSIKHCNEVSDVKIPVLLINTSYNKKVRKFKRVFNFKEIYYIIERSNYGRKNCNRKWIKRRFIWKVN